MFEYLVLVVLCLAVTVPLASYKRRSVGNWLGMTALFGIFSVALLLIMPRVQAIQYRPHPRFIRRPCR
jgi:hypothetical protein